jgi:hypothetical protein
VDASGAEAGASDPESRREPSSGGRVKVGAKVYPDGSCRQAHKVCIGRHGAKGEARGLRWIHQGDADEGGATFADASGTEEYAQAKAMAEAKSPLSIAGANLRTKDSILGAEDRLGSDAHRRLP